MIYCDNPKYKIEDLHICIFPLENTSIVLMFIDSKHKRYRKFYKQFRKLSHIEKLAIVNYIIFLYSEDIFLSKKIPSEILDNENLKKITKQSFDVFKSNPYLNILESEKVKTTFDLNNYNKIPNLLSNQYKLR